MSECVLSELGAYNLLQARPCLVADLLCVAAGTTIRVYSVLSGMVLTQRFFSARKQKFPILSEYSLFFFVKP